MNRFKRVVLVLGASLMSISAFGQLTSSYFMPGSTFRGELNPAFRPLRGYVSLPAVGGTNAKFISNSLTVDNFQVGNLGVNVLGQCLADDSCGSLLLGGCYIFVSIDLSTAHGDKHVSFLYLSRVDVYSCNVGLVFWKNQLYELYVSC